MNLRQNRCFGCASSGFVTHFFSAWQVAVLSSLRALPRSPAEATDWGLSARPRRARAQKLLATACCTANLRPESATVRRCPVHEDIRQKHPGRCESVGEGASTLSSGMRHSRNDACCNVAMSSGGCRFFHKLRARNGTLQVTWYQQHGMRDRTCAQLQGFGTLKPPQCVLDHRRGNLGQASCP